MGYPIIHVTDSHLETPIKFNNITNAVNVYNLIYRESEQENEHCFDCYYAKQLGVTDIKHTEGNLDDYIRSLIILPLIEMDKTVNDIDLDFYYQFKEYLISKKLSQNTIAKHIKTLKTFLNDATDRGISTNFKYKTNKNESRN
jgi:hypothetical protein